MVNGVAMFRSSSCVLLQVQHHLIRNVCYSTSAVLMSKVKVKPVQPPNSSDTDDWIGPPDPDSNLRPIKLHIPENESPTEKTYRMLREETQAWNQEFWAKHNREFFRQKEEFIKNKLQELGTMNKDGNIQRLTPEQISEFYKQFLDLKYEVHKQYNREWYKKNIRLLWHAFKVKVDRTWRKWR